MVGAERGRHRTEPDSLGGPLVRVDHALSTERAHGLVLSQGGTGPRPSKLLASCPDAESVDGAMRTLIAAGPLGRPPPARGDRAAEVIAVPTAVVTEMLQWGF